MANIYNRPALDFKQGRPVCWTIKGGFDIPVMFLMNAWIGVNGIAWATPIAEFVSMLVAVLLFIPFWKGLKRELLLRKAEGASFPAH